MQHDTIQAMPARHERDRAEGAWRHSHELLRYILEHTNSAVAVHDRDLRYIYVSQRYLDAYKVCGQEVIGRHHYEVFPDLPAKWREVHRLALAGQVSRADRDPYCREDGSIEWTRWECRPWYEADGVIGGLVVYTEIITEQVLAEQALRESEARFRDLVESINDVFFSLAPDGRIAYISPSLQATAGYAPAEVMGRRFEEFIEPEDRALIGLAWEDVLAGRLHPSEYRVRTRSGNVMWVRSSSRPVYEEGRLVAVRGILADITERRRAEEARSAQLAELRRWQGIMLAHSDRSQALKREVNTLLARLGQPPRYPSVIDSQPAAGEEPCQPARETP